MQILDERWRELTHREHALFEHLVEFLHRERARVPVAHPRLG
jgi:hypothetical protein